MLWLLCCALWFACRVQRSCSLSQWQPDAFLSPAELVRSKGYPAEEHVTVTEDGYVLSLQRVPRGGRQPPGTLSGPPVLLVHGLLSSAAEWVINYPHQSLGGVRNFSDGRGRRLLRIATLIPEGFSCVEEAFARSGFLLADAGYDVWLGNCRGTPYSRGHREYSDSDGRYWDFRLDEVGLLDLPALVDYVLASTGWPQLFLVGFSQGNTAAWAMLADKPQYNDKILLLVALAPVANMTFIRSPVRFLVPISPILTASAIVANQGRLLVRPEWLRRAAYALCESPLRYACALPIFFLFGVNPNQLNQKKKFYLTNDVGGYNYVYSCSLCVQSRLAVYTSHLPSGASKRNVEQYAQIIRARNFVKYNYGPQRNLYLYGTVESPAYDFSRITAPVALFSARKDFFANPEDVSTLRRSLPNVVLDYIVPDPDFTHLDFVLGTEAAAFVYRPLIDFMNNWVLLNGT
ncbi:lipase 3 [Dermacentor silvarum]|uniref:lipase 3 n=1 Tax=Dermacentor silvarum TaxID=543639 RepID=UPI0021014E8F|nr:lipase 3 [Dermacentor silvarum]